MLIIEIRGKGSFKGAMNYVSDPDIHKGVTLLYRLKLLSFAIPILSNMNRQELRAWVKKNCMLFTAQARRSCSKKEPCGQIVLSFHSKDKEKLFYKEKVAACGYCTESLNYDLIWEIIVRVLKEIGLKNTQVLGLGHFEKDHFHVHIIYNKVDNFGKRINEWQSWKKMVHIQRQVTEEYGLYISKGKLDTDISKLRGYEKVRYMCAIDALIILKRATSIDEFVDSMEQKGWIFNSSQKDLKEGKIFIVGKHEKDRASPLVLGARGKKIDRILAPNSLLKILRLNLETANQPELIALEAQLTDDDYLIFRERLYEISLMMSEKQIKELNKKMEDIKRLDSRRKIHTTKQVSLIDNSKVKPITIKGKEPRQMVKKYHKENKIK